MHDYQPHNKKVTGIWVQSSKSVITCSHDFKIFIKSLNKNDYDDKVIEINKEGLAELQCIDVIRD